jgi:hypothetical protein
LADGREDEEGTGPRDRDAFAELIARAEDAQVRMQVELTIERLQRYLEKHAAYHNWCREQDREA